MQPTTEQEHATRKMNAQPDQDNPQEAVLKDMESVA